MSKKKSLGSSPIGYSRADIDAYEFIPTISGSTESAKTGFSHNSEVKESDSRNETYPSKEEAENVEKKIVSYYLEEGLIDRLKKVADDQKMYYSTLVSNAIQMWLDKKSLE